MIDRQDVRLRKVHRERDVYIEERHVVEPRAFAETTQVLRDDNVVLPAYLSHPPNHDPLAAPAPNSVSEELPDDETTDTFALLAATLLMLR